MTVNDDDAPAATIKAGTSPVTEGTAASFTVELSTPAPTGGLSIALTVADASGSDFVASTNEGSKTLAFNAGDTSKTYSVATVTDTVDEPNGDVTVTVGTGTGYTVGTPSSATVTVNDDDNPAATIKAGTSPVTEGTAATFTVQLSTAAPTGGLSIALTVADASGSDFVRLDQRRLQDPGLQRRRHVQDLHGRDDRRHRRRGQRRRDRDGGLRHGLHRRHAPPPPR